MRGDLHTLKRVCTYASAVMLAGEIVFAALFLAYIVMGIGSFFSGDMSRTLFDILNIHSDSSWVKVAGMMEGAVIITMAFVTVKMVRDTMESLRKEYSPFIADNVYRMKSMSVFYLVCSFILLVLMILAQNNLVFILGVFFGCLMVSVVVYCLTIICRYGMLLQKESDETL